MLTLLDEREIRALLQLAAATVSDVPADYYPTAFSPDVDLKRRIHRGIQQVLEARLRALLPDFRPIMHSFVAKRAKSTRGRLGLHQDYTLADPGEHASVNIWCPLIDVDQRNGCMKVVPGSQAFNHISATPPNPAPYDSVRDILENECMVEVPMSAGSALVFDTRVLHATEENLTQRLRFAVLCNLVPKAAVPRLYLWDNDKADKLQPLAIDTEVLLRLVPNTYPDDPESLGARFLDEIDYRFEPLTPEQVAPLRRDRAPTG